MKKKGSVTEKNIGRRKKRKNRGQGCREVAFIVWKVYRSMNESTNVDIFVTNGCSNHSKEEREKNDYYATSPFAVEKLLEKETFSHKILEPSVGGGHIAEVLKKKGYEVICNDIIDRGYPNTIIQDFLKRTEPINCDSVQNPPYKFAKEFYEHTAELMTEGHKAAFLFKLTFLESKGRYKTFKKYPFKKLYVFSCRASCAKNGEFGKYSERAIAYGWYILEKGFKGKPEIEWLI